MAPLIHFFSWFRRRSFMLQLGMLWFLMIPIVSATLYSYIHTRNELTQTALSKHETVAVVSAALIKERFDHLIDTGVSLTKHPQIQAAFRVKKWAAAVVVIEQLIDDIPDMEQLFVTDLNGIEYASLPHQRGKANTKHRGTDWYRGVSFSEKPYVSGVYLTTDAEPHSLIAIALPVFDEKSEKRLGMIVLEIRLDKLLAWSGATEIGSEGYLFIVDQYGQLAASPKYPDNTTLVNYSSALSVQKALRGEQGAEIIFDPLEQVDMLAAFTPVTTYGWAVIAQQPPGFAFAARDRSLRFMMAIYVAAAMLIGGLIYMLSRAMKFVQLPTESPYKLPDVRIAPANLRTVPGNCVVIVDQYGKITQINERAARVLGRENMKVDGMDYFDIIFPVDADGTPIPPERVPLLIALETGKQVSSPAWYYYTKQDGTRFPISSTATPLIEHGTTVGAIVEFTELSQ